MPRYTSPEHFLFLAALRFRVQPWRMRHQIRRDLDRGEALLRILPAAARA